MEDGRKGGEEGVARRRYKALTTFSAVRFQRHRESCRKRWMKKVVVWRARRDPRSTKLVFWKAQGGVGSTKIMFCGAPGDAGT